MADQEIVPEIKGLISPDLGASQLPEHPDDCSVFVEADIGIAGQEGADIFSFTVVTRTRLANEAGTQWGHGILMVDRFSWETVRSALSKLLMHARRPTWEAVANELSKRLDWEFENYEEKK